MAAKRLAAIRAERSTLDISTLTLERLVTAPEFAAFPASKVQRAVCRAVDGQDIGDLLTPEQTLYHFGTESLTLTHQPKYVFLRTGVRAGKSLLAACAVIKSVLTCTFRRPVVGDEVPGPDGLVGVLKGELVRALILAPLLKLARAVFSHLVGVMQSSKVLAPLLVKVGAESCVIRRLDGQEVLVELVAASSGGANLRSTWLAAAVFDEADFHDGEDGAVNLPENYKAATTRLLSGGQLWIPSSPWADEGPFYELFTGAFGNPGDELAVHSSTRAMNPTFPLSEVEAEEKRDPENAAREFHAVPLKSGSKLFFSQDALEKCIDRSRTGDAINLPTPLRRSPHAAGTDFGFRKNSSALALARANEGGDKVVLAFQRELRPEPGAPLKPSEVVAEFGLVCQQYGAEAMTGDSYYADSAHEHLAALEGHSVAYLEWAPTGEAQAEAFTKFRTLMQEGKLSLPNDPRLISQIRAVRTKKLAGGKIGVQLPKQGWAHGDLLMAVVLACIQVGLVERETEAEEIDIEPSRWSGEGRGFG